MHVMAKPTGPICNLDCEYCFYTEKAALFPNRRTYRMSDAILERYIKEYIAMEKAPEILFTWQGGEPTLAGLGFFKKAVKLQKKYASGRRISNALQTNGALLNQEWCKFLKANNFLVGISLDGPEHIHDRHRVDRKRRPTFSRVMNGLALLQKHQVEYNVLSSISREASAHPLEIYRFLKENGVRFVQFTPIVERKPDANAVALGLRHGIPGVSKSQVLGSSDVTPWSVEPEPYGAFLIQIFDEWVRNDVGHIFVMNFEWSLASWMGLPSTVCIFSKTCGESVIVEQNGDIYACDHFVYPQYRLGNLADSPLIDMCESAALREFGAVKEASLASVCNNCEVKFACQGGCPKHRFLKSSNGEPGLNYFCEGYKKYFNHIHRYMTIMGKLIENDLPAEKVMDVAKGAVLAVNLPGVK
jgi:uncharacterized protein